MEKKTNKQGLARWFKEEWKNQRGEVGYKNTNDVYRPTRRVTPKTPLTFNELTKYLSSLVSDSFSLIINEEVCLAIKFSFFDQKSCLKKMD